MIDIFLLLRAFVTWDSKLTSTQRPFWSHGGPCVTICLICQRKTALIGSFFAIRDPKTLAKGKVPLQELEVGLLEVDLLVKVKKEKYTILLDLFL